MERGEQESLGRSHEDLDADDRKEKPTLSGIVAGNGGLRTAISQLSAELRLAFGLGAVVIFLSLAILVHWLKSAHQEAPSTAAKDEIATPGTPLEARVVFAGSEADKGPPVTHPQEARNLGEIPSAGLGSPLTASPHPGNLQQNSGSLWRLPENLSAPGRSAPSTIGSIARESGSPIGAGDLVSANSQAPVAASAGQSTPAPQGSLDSAWNTPPEERGVWRGSPPPPLEPALLAAASQPARSPNIDARRSISESLPPALPMEQFVSPPWQREAGAGSPEREIRSSDSRLRTDVPDFGSTTQAPTAGSSAEVHSEPIGPRARLEPRQAASSPLPGSSGKGSSLQPGSSGRGEPDLPNTAFSERIVPLGSGSAPQTGASSEASPSLVVPSAPLVPESPRTQPAENSASRGAPSTQANTADQRLYHARAGESVFEIARHQLGRATRWVDLLRLNPELATADFKTLESLPQPITLRLPEY